ncbi:helix-turn-helix domain-containing protein [Amycolatopsis pithecellobii]|nr:helix-turn-helix transcriptional regulator [Amycolatopsis pithecellobii]
MDNSDTRVPRSDAFAAAVGNILRELRLGRGWTRAELSTRTAGEIAGSSISSYESGYRALKLEILATLCTALDVRVDAVFTAAERRAREGAFHAPEL